jgi:Flp pilus assembly protein TadD
VLRSYEALGGGKLDEAIDGYHEALRLEPADSFARKQLVAALSRRAWTLANDRDPQKREPGRAVKLATEVVELTPKAADPWNNLGVARYRAGDFAGAVVALEKFRELRTNSPNRNNPFFLAMANWQLGKKDEAHRWYEEGMNWMDTPAHKPAILLRTQNEAAELLGLGEK